ncbi:MAG: hypothetical protein HF978_07660 [Desulfobacteraceae bacterium]|nr:SCP2 sterol-binding domain-containing protein [Desulfobacteraceae bacterium]MBC2755405.1 hypothetical protein [Desulfobacteraceae bacterium]MBC2764155.1 hypothetical protein [ANME-2 cluster archaeon]
MKCEFPSPEWVAAYEKATMEDDVLKGLLKKWDATVCTYFLAYPKIGMDEDVSVLLDLRGGVARSAKLVPIEEGRDADFVFSGIYDKWKLVIREELDPVRAAISGQLKLTGSLPTIVRNIKLIKRLVKCTSLFDSVFPDEYDDPSKLDEYKAYIKKFRSELKV